MSLCGPFVQFYVCFWEGLTFFDVILQNMVTFLERLTKPAVGVPFWKSTRDSLL